MHCSWWVPLLLPIAFASARPGILDGLGILQNLGVVLNDQPGKYIKGDPAKGDVRSPCPALNVLANHGYLYVGLNIVMCQLGIYAPRIKLLTSLKSSLWKGSNYHPNKPCRTISLQCRPVFRSNPFYQWYRLDHKRLRPPDASHIPNPRYHLEPGKPRYSQCHRARCFINTQRSRTRQQQRLTACSPPSAAQRCRRRCPHNRQSRQVASKT
jgi:hypothetical protein